jgi:hypothetical protein
MTTENSLEVLGRLYNTLYVFWRPRADRILAARNVADAARMVAMFDDVVFLWYRDAPPAVRDGLRRSIAMQMIGNWDEEERVKRARIRTRAEAVIILDSSRQLLLSRDVVRHIAGFL